MCNENTWETTAYCTKTPSHPSGCDGAELFVNKVLIAVAADKGFCRQPQTELETEGECCNPGHGVQLRRVVLELPEGLFLRLGQRRDQFFFAACGELQDVRVFAAAPVFPLRRCDVAVV